MLQVKRNPKSELPLNQFSNMDVIALGILAAVSISFSFPEVSVPELAQKPEVTLCNQYFRWVVRQKFKTWKWSWWCVSRIWTVLRMCQNGRLWSRCRFHAETERNEIRMRPSHWLSLSGNVLKISEIIGGSSGGFPTGVKLHNLLVFRKWFNLIELVNYKIIA